MPGGRIFVTHASADREIAEALVDLLRLGTGVDESRVFCSSVEGHGVPTGEDIVEHIKNELEDTLLSVHIVTPKYLSSTFCMLELGAIWVLNVKMVLLLVPPVTKDDLWGTPLGGRVLERLDDEAGLNRLRDRMVELLELQKTSTTAWETKRSEFLTKKVPSLQLSSKPAGIELSKEEGQSVRLLLRRVRTVLVRLRKAAFVWILNEPGQKHAEEFLSRIKESADAIQSVFTLLTGVECRVCIKQTFVKKHVCYVTDLARSGDSTLQDFADAVHENTDFETLYQDPKKKYFFCNDLGVATNEGWYKNSHWKGGVPAKPSYVATVVWPITKTLNDPRSAKALGSPTQMQDLVGFLCVDSAVAGAFDEARDVDFGIGVAATLYYVLRPWDGDLKARAHEMTKSDTESLKPKT